MLKLKAALMGLAVAVMACLALALPPLSQDAHAQPTNRAITYKPLGTAAATAGTTFATTSYADLAGATITFTPTRDPTNLVFQNGPTIYQHVRINWSLDVIKATTTTGTCAVYVNGAVVAATAQTVDVAAKNTNMGGVYDVQLTAAGSQVVKLQCKSGDTAVFTVNFGQLIVDEIF